MRTESLTAVLAANLEPVDARRTTWRYALGMTASALAALTLTAEVLHVNPALPHEVSELAFWVRELYCASLGVLAVLCVARLGRPGTRLGLLNAGAFLGKPSPSVKQRCPKAAQTSTTGHHHSRGKPIFSEGYA